MKRLFDIFFSTTILTLASPVLLPVMFFVWWQDYHSPFYIAPRVGRGNRVFRMVKMRSMKIGADRAGIDSTKSDDPRITAVGRFIRRYKIDEVTQLWNVLMGDMSVVGPRPNVQRDVGLYTQEESRLLSVRPGVTDFASIVFADEGDILKGHRDPDLRYNQVIRPWKSRLGLLYVDHRSFVMDLKLVLATLMALFYRKKGLGFVAGELKKLGVSDQLIQISKREIDLYPFPPPGASQVVATR